jgi:hypothetical protein
VRVAQDLVEGAKPYTSEVQASLLLAVGIRTHQAKVISRWMGIGLLVPGCLNDLGTVSLTCSLGPSLFSLARLYANNGADPA